MLGLQTTKTALGCVGKRWHHWNEPHIFLKKYKASTKTNKILASTYPEYLWCTLYIYMYAYIYIYNHIMVVIVSKLLLLLWLLKLQPSYPGINWHVIFTCSEHAWKVSVIAPTFNKRPKRTNRNNLPRRMCFSERILLFLYVVFTCFFVAVDHQCLHLLI